MTQTVQVCPTSTFPTFDSIYNQIKGLNIAINPKFPDMPHLPTMPSLPSMPSPMFPNMTMPDVEKPNLTFSIVLNQIFKWFEAIIGKLTSFLGTTFTFPDIPHLNIKLPDLLNPNFDLSALVPNLPEFNFSLPSLPNPMLPNMHMPEFEGVAKIQALIANYCTTLVTSLTGILDSVISKLNAKPFQLGLSMPTLPTIPTDFSGLMALVPTLNLTMPDPIFGDFRNPSLEQLELSKNYYLALVSKIGKTIDDFVASIAGYIGGWTPPVACVNIPVTA
jgi:hypothetical protein